MDRGMIEAPWESRRDWQWLRSCLVLLYDFPGTFAMRLSWSGCAELWKYQHAIYGQNKFRPRRQSAIFSESAGEGHVIPLSNRIVGYIKPPTSLDLIYHKFHKSCFLRLLHRWQNIHTREV